MASTLYAVCLVLVGCGGSSLSRGANYYSEGRYIDASQLFEHTEGELSKYDPAEQARYGLYRGATLLRLGDVAEAERWLAFSARVAAKHQRALSSRESVALGQALAASEARLARHDAPLAAPSRLLPATTADALEATPAALEIPSSNF